MTSSLRARLTVISVVASAIGLAVAAVSLVLILDRSLYDELERSLDARADDISEQIDSLNEEIVLGPGVGGDTFATVVSTDGSYYAASDDRFGFEEDVLALVAAIPTLDDSFDLSIPSIGVTDDGYLAVAHWFDVEPFAAADADVRDIGTEDYLTIVAASTEPIERTVSTVTVSLAIGVPLLVVAIGGLVWWIAGRALRPVEAIRREVETITADALDQRVPESGRDDEIGRLAATMNTMLARLEASERRQRRFVADASHELRSPLASLAARLDVEQRHGDAASWNESLPAVAGDVTRLRTLVEDLLTLARSDADETQVRPRQLVDLDDLVFEVAATVGGDVDLTAVSAGTVRGDRDQLHRVILNLLDNAVRHADDRVAVSLVEADGKVQLVVDDDGHGVPSEQRDTIFERFVRLDEARARDTGGSGLGLAIVAELVQQHDARVDVGDSPLGGARFVVTLPAG